MGKQAKKTVKKALGKARLRDLKLKDSSKVKGGGTTPSKSGWDIKENKKV